MGSGRRASSRLLALRGCWFMLRARRTNLFRSFAHLPVLAAGRCMRTLLQQCVDGVSIRGLLVAIHILSGRSQPGA